MSEDLPWSPASNIEPVLAVLKLGLFRHGFCYDNVFSKAKDCGLYFAFRDPSTKNDHRSFKSHILATPFNILNLQVLQ